MGIKNDPNTHVYTKCKMEIFIEKTKRRPKTNKQTNKQNKRKIEKKRKICARFTFQIVESIVKFHRGC